ncbi:MAG: protein phosphatase 2C domain-containing protein [Nitrospinota bacterium]|nr:protein phosphatase 2C domain-containing protein [Nitrospinota bacterium]
MMEISGLTDKGKVRTHNEDAWFADGAMGLLVVSDGMGSEEGGALAAEIVVKTLPEIIMQEGTNIANLNDPFAVDIISKQIVALNRNVFDSSRGKVNLAGMGATMVMALVRGDRAMIAHMGDSRAYLYRDDYLLALTKDHSVIRLLLDAGEITEEEVASHPARGKITRFIGMEDDVPPDISLIHLENGDRILLCSDGLTSMLGEKEIQEQLRKTVSPKAVCRYLVDAANMAGGKDNITAVLADWRIDAAE